jgi:hypothetical protein
MWQALERTKSTTLSARRTQDPNHPQRLRGQSRHRPPKDNFPPLN